jgi:hypothetical protein
MYLPCFYRPVVGSRANEGFGPDGWSHPSYPRPSVPPIHKCRQTHVWLIGIGRCRRRPAVEVATQASLSVSVAFAPAGWSSRKGEGDRVGIWAWHVDSLRHHHDRCIQGSGEMIDDRHGKAWHVGHGRQRNRGWYGRMLRVTVGSHMKVQFGKGQDS